MLCERVYTLRSGRDRQILTSDLESVFSISYKYKSQVVTCIHSSKVFVPQSNLINSTFQYLTQILDESSCHI